VIVFVVVIVVVVSSVGEGEEGEAEVMCRTCWSSPAGEAISIHLAETVEGMRRQSKPALLAAPEEGKRIMAS
jgi:hypothetical protein